MFIMLSSRFIALSLFGLLAIACTSSEAADDDTGEATGAATGGGEGASCTRSDANACASGLKCIDSKCTKECSSSTRCDSGWYCIPESSYSSSGVCKREASDEGEKCIEAYSSEISCGSGLKCKDHECVKTCSRYSSCGFKTCIPDGFYSSNGTCKSSKANLGQPCFEDSTCNYGQKCDGGMCKLR